MPCLKTNYTLFSEGLKLVNIEDCTQVGSEQSKKNECGQRNVIKLKEKINELVEWVINPEYIK